jgi:hypothetical protein
MYCITHKCMFTLHFTYFALMNQLFNLVNKILYIVKLRTVFYFDQSAQFFCYYIIQMNLS